MVLASGAGSTFEAVVESTRVGRLNLKILALVVDRPCGAIEIARQNNISCAKIAPIVGLPIQIWDEKLYQFLKSVNPDVILSLGFLRKLEKKVIENFKGKIINTHPSLLPKYGGRGMFGRHIHKAVVKNKESETGVTIHLVNENYDEGQILAQKKIQVSPLDSPESLEMRIKDIEKQFLIKTLEKL